MTDHAVRSELLDRLRYRLSLPLGVGAGGLQAWRRQAFDVTFLLASLAGAIIYVSSLAMALHSSDYALVVSFSVAYAAVLVVAFARSLPTPLRIWIATLTTYVLGLTALLASGPFGSGRLWLFVFVIVVTVLLGLRSAIIAMAVNVMTLVVVTWLREGGRLVWPESSIDARLWLTSSITFMVLGGFVAAILGILISSLERSLDRQHGLTGELRREVEERSLASAALAKRLEMEQIISKVATRFINCTPDQIDNEVVVALQAVAGFLGCSQAAVLQTDVVGTPPTVSHRWIEEGGEELPLGADELGTALAGAAQGTSIVVGEPRSPILAVPLMAGSSLSGLLALAGFKGGRAALSDDVLPLPSLVGYLIMNALEQRRTLAARSDSEERFHQAFHAISSATSLSRLADGTYIDVNEGFTALTGYSMDDVLVKGELVEPLTWAVPADRERMLAALTAHGEVHGMEAQFRRKDGSLRLGTISVTRIDSGSEPIILSVTQDITDRRRAEQVQGLLYRISTAAQTSRDLPALFTAIHRELGRVLDTRNFFIALYDADNDTISVPYHADEYDKVSTFRAGRTLTAYVIKQAKPLLARREELDRMTREGLVESIGAPSAVWLGVPLKVGDEVIGALVVQSYATERAYTVEDQELLTFVSHQVGLSIQSKRAEEALAAERASLAQRVAERTAELTAANIELERAARVKDEFMANMSHELRTPLNAVLGLAEALSEGVYGELNARQLRALGGIADSGRHLLDLINDILDLSKIAAGKLEIELRPLVVRAVCQSCLETVKPLAQKKRLELQSRFDMAVSTVHADSRRLKQLLVNLLSNAIKFTPEGGTVSLEVIGDPGKRAARFVVSDTGIGISRQDMTRLFQPFVQLDSGLSRMHTGTGLGLALVYRLAEMHGGGVTVESSGVAGQGSRFTVSIPWEPEEAEPVSEAGDLDARPQTVLPPQFDATLDVLLAEDNDASREFMSEYLEILGCRVTTACDGLEATSLALEQKPTLIFMDIQMPEVNGLEAIRRIRSSDLFPQPYIVALTALAMAGDRDRCLEAGADDYLSKPISLTALADIVKHHLERQGIGGEPSSPEPKS